MVGEAPTLLKALLAAEHAQKFETFRARYERTARDMEAPELAGTAPSKAQFYRWLSGQLKGGIPYPDACRVLERMFPGTTAVALFGPAPAELGVPGSPPVFHGRPADIVAAFASRPTSPRPIRPLRYSREPWTSASPVCRSI